jgi:AcrR family transcriptional regulator
VPPDKNASDEKRARILEAAYEVCEKHGVVGARMEEVAALAQVSKGTLYRYFQSKEDLFLATIIESYASGLRTMELKVGGAGDPRSLLATILEGLVEIFRLVSPRTRVQYQAWGVIAAHPALEERLLGFLKSFHDRRRAQLQQVIRAGQLAGQFRTDLSPELIATSIGALLSGFFHIGTFDPETAHPDTLKASFDALVMGLLVRDDTPRLPALPEGDV